MGMMKGKTRAYCRRCRHEQVFVRSVVHHRVHLFFSAVTLGLWSVGWLAICVGQFFWPWRCEHCRWAEPEFRDCRDEKAEAKNVEEEAPGPRAA